MSAAFTPGPWKVDAHNNVMAQGGLVAFPGIAARFDQEANARLIASAPDLLEALQRLLNLDADEYLTAQGVRNLARAAVAKATGSQA